MSGDDSNDNSAANDQATVNDILEMLREAGVSTKDLEEKKHAFWDTQVCQSFVTCMPRPFVTTSELCVYMYVCTCFFTSIL